MTPKYKVELMSESIEVLDARADALVAADRQLLSDLIALRTKRDLPQREVAERMGVSQSAVSQFERYDANPTLATLRRYAMSVGARVEHRVVDDIVAPDRVGPTARYEASTSSSPLPLTVASSAPSSRPSATWGPFLRVEVTNA